PVLGMWPRRKSQLPISLSIRRNLAENGSGVVLAFCETTNGKERKLMTQICVTCGTQFPPSSETLRGCPICQDERQFIGPHGQEWISLDELRNTHRNFFFEEGWRLWGIHTEPEFGIGQ